MLFVELNKEVSIYLPRSWFETIATSFSGVYRLRGDWHFSLALVTPNTIKKLNAAYRGKDKVTDVLSFAEEADGFIAHDKNYLGEIVICVSRARQQSKEYGHSLQHEMARLLIHGLAHLAGFDHENVSPKEAEKMVAFEKKVIDYYYEHKK